MLCFCSCRCNTVAISEGARRHPPPRKIDLHGVSYLRSLSVPVYKSIFTEYLALEAHASLCIHKGWPRSNSYCLPFHLPMRKSPPLTTHLCHPVGCHEGHRWPGCSPHFLQWFSRSEADGSPRVGVGEGGSNVQSL